MNHEKNEPRMPLFSEFDEPEDYNYYIYGSKPDEDTFGKVLRRYADETTLSNKQICELAGISQSGFSSYCNDHQNISYENLILLCIALRLHPLRQEYLLSFTPYELRKSDPRYFIFRSFLSNCAFIEKYTVDLLKQRLKAKQFKSLV